MNLHAQLDPASPTPLYRQLYDHISSAIREGKIQGGERIPATRELAGLLGLNRATVSAAYQLLRKDGLISGQVGRGSFVRAGASANGGVHWSEILDSRERLLSAAQAASSAGVISFSAARPSSVLFPISEFREVCAEVTAGDRLPEILQLGSPSGYAPLREYLAAEARREGVMRSGDDILVSSGCQQAIDLLVRVLVRPGDAVILEDPTYPGLTRAFARAGARTIGVAVDDGGLDVDQLERAIAEERPRLIVVTGAFQNPTGATLAFDRRRAILRLAEAGGVVVIENDIYGALRYEGKPLPALKQIDERGDVILLRSFSKIAFPGLRVGWVTAPRAVISALAAAKQWTDLHSDHLSQAVLLRFAESGRLARHLDRVLATGRAGLRAIVAACGEHLPPGARFTRPQGGMNLWVRLPEAIDAAELRGRAEGVSYLPGGWFTVTRPHRSSLRLSFGGLTPDEIGRGVAILGRAAAVELERLRAAERFGPAPAMV
jgi:2-aminoadipate transaminase